MKIAFLLTLLLTGAAPLLSTDSAQAGPSGAGYCYGEANCGGGLLGYYTPGTCSQAYGKSWRDETGGGACRNL